MGSPRFLVTLALLAATACARAREGEINPIVGDASWIEAHGEPPGPDADEDERIRTHLLWAEQHLREADVSHLAPGLRAERAAMLDALHEYALAGAFPRLAEPRPRTPRFTDHLGNVCAVGHLVAITEGRDVVDAIAREHEHERVMEMDLPFLDAWAAAHGLTRLELATIQPTYELMRPPLEEAPPAIPATRAELETALVHAQADLLACVPETAGRTTITVRAFLRPGRRTPIVHAVVGVSPRAPEVARCVETVVRRAAMGAAHGRRVRRTIEAGIRVVAERP